MIRPEPGAVSDMESQLEGCHVALRWSAILGHRAGGTEELRALGIDPRLLRLNGYA